MKLFHWLSIVPLLLILLLFAPTWRLFSGWRARDSSGWRARDSSFCWKAALKSSAKSSPESSNLWTDDDIDDDDDDDDDDDALSGRTPDSSIVESSNCRNWLSYMYTSFSLLSMDSIEARGEYCTPTADVAHDFLKKLLPSSILVWSLWKSLLLKPL